MDILDHKPLREIVEKYDRLLTGYKFSDGEKIRITMKHQTDCVILEMMFTAMIEK